MLAARTALVAPELEGPLDRAVRAVFGSSWGRARAWIASGKVRVGERLVLEPTARVRAGERLTLDERAPGRRAETAALHDSSVVYVDAQVVVVLKPAGVSTIPYDDPDEDTLEARVRRWLERGARKRGKTGKAGQRPSLGVVHRLDKETSGLIVFTRTWLAKKQLAAQFRGHTVHRRYLAIAHGDVPAATLRSHLLEDRGDGLRGSARGVPPQNARFAVTHVERLESLRDATLVACRLETGRTHQIRIHLSESGHPLVGERVYVRRWAGPLLPAPRLMLHAAELGFVHPVTEQQVSWEAPMPDDMAEVLRGLRC